MIVVDASVAAKWLLAEADSEIALSILERHEGQLSAPDLLAIEVSRALVTAANMRRIDRDRALSGLRLWLRIVDGKQIALHPSTPCLGAGAEIALDLGHPLPDCIYLALAMELGCPLVTADRKFAPRASTIYDRVLILGDV